MKVKVTIAGGVEISKCIESVNLKVDTPDDSDARSTEMGNIMEITGKIGAGESTKGLYEWSLAKPDKENKDQVYREVTVSMILADEDEDGEPIRKVVFPQAFVVDYSEKYSKKEGVGIFTLFLKQKKDNNEKVTVEESMKAVKKSGEGPGFFKKVGDKFEDSADVINKVAKPVKAVGNLISGIDKVREGKETLQKGKELAKDGLDKSKDFLERGKEKGKEIF
mgnify:CR=1 FL=1